MGSNQAFELAILISLKDAASAGADTISAHLRGLGKDGRQALQTFEDLRKDMRQGLVMGGVGVAGLQMLRGGIKSAGDFEAAMGDLRMTLEELGTDGRINIGKLNDELNRSEQLALRLGNALPGTTQDFIEMMSTLKQGGTDVETILGGAGEAVADLAVVTGNVPKQLAEPFSQYVQLFKLNAKETIELTNTLARLRFATGLTPQELIEGSKFFQTRAGMPLGLSGLKGADEGGRLLATLRSFGLEGGIGGRELGGVVVGLTFNTKEQQKKLQELKSKHGITLEFFDKKGQWKGFENAFAQMEKLRKLSTEQRLEFGEKLFGREGMGIASIMMKAGVEGWREINARIDKVPPLQELINQKTATYNAKLEAVQGTFENLRATTFTPMLDTLKPALDLANQFTGELQEFAKENPSIANLATKLIGVGSATLIVAGGIKSMTAAYKLWQIASAFRAGQSPLAVSLLGGVSAGTAQGNINNSLNQIFGRNVVVAGQTSARTAGTRIGGAFTSALKFTLLAFGIEALVENLLERGQQAVEKRQAKTNIADLEKEEKGIRQKQREFRANPEDAARLKEIDKRIGELQVAEIAGTRSKDTVSMFADPSKFASDLALASRERNPLRRGFIQSFFDVVTPGHQMKKDFPEYAERPLKADLQSLHFRSAEAMKAWLESIRQSGAYTEQEIVTLNRLATEVYPQYANELVNLRSNLTDANSAVAEFASSLRLNRPTFFSFFPTPSAPGSKPSVGSPSVPKMATGGLIEREGLVHIHTGERVVPAAKVRRDADRAGERRSDGSLHLHFHIPPDSPAAKDRRGFVAYVTREVRTQKERR
jgi:TP901 family phage tail tape measure protein